MSVTGQPPARRMGSRMRAQAEQAVLQRRVFPYLAAVTAVLAVGTGVIAHLIDREDFPSIEDGIWWSIVTLGTVGYGDIVPHTTWGRVLGSFVIIFGVTFISFLIATVTSVFVDADREKLESKQAAREEEIRDLLLGMNERLAAIEARLADTLRN